jgi:hypothetical protein
MKELDRPLRNLRNRGELMAKKKDHLAYGEGQREQYGEGMSYRPEEKTAAAQNFNDSSFAGGERKKKSVPDAPKPADEGR